VNDRGADSKGLGGQFSDWQDQVIAAALGQLAEGRESSGSRGDAPMVCQASRGGGIHLGQRTA
jgi:hypothetical protein